MRAKIYCMQCGTGIEYGATKPNFCNNCGTSLGSNDKPQEMEYDECNEDDSNIEININQLEVEIDNSDWQQHKVEFGRVVGTRSSPPEKPAKKKRGPGRPKKFDREAFLEEFKKEAGESRRSNKSNE